MNLQIKSTTQKKWPYSAIIFCQLMISFTKTFWNSDLWWFSEVLVMFTLYLHVVYVLLVSCWFCSEASLGPYAWKSEKIHETGSTTPLPACGEAKKVTQKIYATLVTTKELNEASFEKIPSMKIGCRKKPEAIFNCTFSCWCRLPATWWT